MEKHFYLTTAIDYANGPPHLGHAYEKVLADVLARYRRLVGERVHFLTGIDEHGQKVTQTAQAQGKTPEALTAEVAPRFVELCRALDISNDDFIRTSEARHKAVVAQALQQLYEQGDIYKAEYQGYYSVRQEQFVLEKEKVDGAWPELYGEVIEIAEPNYFFRLQNYQDWLIDYLEHHALVVPAYRQKQVREFLKEPVNDLCISRPISRLSWGIPLPFDPDYVTYVWFDALLNYVSAVFVDGTWSPQHWPADYHVIGKDILVPSHSVYWPAMLKALDWPLPKQLLVHGWWHLGGAKLSKSGGVTVDPIDFAATYGPDALRYYLIREMSVGQDADFTHELFLARYNGDLANNLGNLVSRLLNMAGKHFQAGLPACERVEAPEENVSEHWKSTAEAVQADFADFAYHRAMERLFGFFDTLNSYAETRQPWKLAKSSEPADRQLLATSLVTLAEGLRLGRCLLAPVMPRLCDRLSELLAQDPVTRWTPELLAWNPSALEGVQLGAKTILFPRPEAAPAAAAE